jgi:hypothetical protein
MCNLDRLEPVDAPEGLEQLRPFIMHMDSLGSHPAHHIHATLLR